ncbi:MAG: CPBP family glutamic-type intramembrane protease [Pseudomonadota bacterium]
MRALLSSLVQPIQTFLFSPTLPLWRYCLLAFPLASIPSLVLLFMATTTFTLNGIDISTIQTPARDLTLTTVILSIVIAPIIETLILGYALTVLASTAMHVSVIALVSGLAWGIFHGLSGPLRFFGPTWGFFVMSCAYLHWRKISFRHAFLSAAIPHSLNNALVLSIAAFLHS